MPKAIMFEAENFFWFIRRIMLMMNALLHFFFLSDIYVL
jgi:hypothetical protein